jgi:glycosyltransferase involved in cell wall biosynthesis
MNILVFSQYFWPENFRINDLVKGLLARGIHVDVVTGQPNYPEGQIYDGYRSWNFIRTIWEGVTVYRLPLTPRGRSSGIRLAFNYLSFVLSGILLAPFALRRKRVDVVFVYAISPILQAIPAILVKWIKRAKLIIWVQDLWPESLKATGFVHNRWLLLIMGIVVRWIYRHADLILVQSEAFIEPVAALADRKKICYYPNSADDVFSSSAVLSDCPIDSLTDNVFSVVFAGNLGAAQSVDTIIDAAALLKAVSGIRIILVGDGSRADWIRDQIQLRELDNVVMIGRYPLELMPSILGRADALLVTLSGEPIFYHTVPSKIQAYLAMGRPIIACINGEGARIVMQANAGISCRAQDSAALADAIKQLSNMTLAEREKFGQNGRHYFQTHYDNNLLMQTLISHFENLLNSPRH